MKNAIQKFYDTIHELSPAMIYFALGIWIRAWDCRQFEMDDKDMLIEALYKRINDLEKGMTTTKPEDDYNSIMAKQ